MVVRGVLQEISAGKEIERGTGTFTSRETWGGAGPTVTKEGQRQFGGWIRHSSIVIGDRRISGDVMIRPAHEELLQAALGQEVAVSFSRFGKTYRVEATKTEDGGVVKTPVGMLIGGTLVRLWRLLFAVIGGLILAVILWWIAYMIIGAIVGHSALVSVACFFLALLLPVWLIWATFSGMFKTYAAWMASLLGPRKNLRAPDAPCEQRAPGAGRTRLRRTRRVRPDTSGCACTACSTGAIQGSLRKAWRSP
jgi:hypothetical protein